MNELEFYKMLSQKADREYSSVTDLLPKVQDEGLRQDMARQMDGYRRFSRIAQEHLSATGRSGGKPSRLSALPGRMGRMVNTMFNTSREHIATLMIHNSNASILALHRTMNRLAEYKGSDEAVALCRQVIDFEQENITRMQKYI